MKKEIHPKYHTINLVWVDGSTTQTRSTWGKEGDTIRLDIDPTNHPAWTGKTQLTRGNQLDKFNKRFAGIGAAGAASKEQDGTQPAAAEKKAAK